jgi:hypothetical protein
MHRQVHGDCSTVRDALDDTARQAPQQEETIDDEQQLE